MSKIAQYKAQMRARRAAALGLTEAEFDAHSAEQQRLNDEMYQSMYNRVHQFAMIAFNANFHNRTFTKFEVQ